MENSMALGIDIGGSHITAALVDLHSRTILTDSIHRSRVSSQGSLEEILDSWVAIIDASVASLNGKRFKVGMAMPGPFDYEEGVSLMVGQDKYDSFYGLNIKQLLADRLSIKKDDILMMNDASCFLKGEVFGGVAQACKKVIGLTLGTGLGTAKYYSDFTYDAELWCLPFLDSIVEDYTSTRWFIKTYKKLSGVQVNDVKELTYYVEKDSLALSVFEDFGTNLGYFLVEFIKMEDPEMVVLGGNIAKAYHLFMGNTRKVLSEHQVSVPILQAGLGEHAAIIGAASLWENHRELA